MDTIIYKSIKSLPPLDDTVAKIQQICCDENSSLSDLTNIIEKDPMLTANILRSANSPLYGFSREITDIKRSVTLFGMATIRGFALSSVIKKSFVLDLDPYNITNSDFLNISNLQHALMFHWYSKINREALNIVLPAAFMMEVGKIIISHELINNGKALIFKNAVQNAKNLEDITFLESNLLEIDSEMVTAKIFEQWNLETELIDTILYSNNPNEAPEHIKPFARALKIVKTAINILKQATDQSVQDALKLVDEYGLDREIFTKAIEKVKV